MLRPHHTCICTDVYIQDNSFLLDPELWTKTLNVQFLTSLRDRGFIETEDYMPISEYSEFIVIKDGFFDCLKETDYLSYTVFAEKRYFEDMQYWHTASWSADVNVDAMFLLGWTVYSFIEPAILFGDYPIQPILDGEKIMGYHVNDYSLINKWGLLKDYDSALEVVRKNEAQNVLYNESDIYRWHALAIYVDKHTFLKLEKRSK